MTKNLTTTRVSSDDLRKAVLQLEKYFDSLKKIYVGRDRVIEIIKYAMLQKSHALFFGVPGTAKSAIADSLFAGITSSTQFKVQITAFMAEDAIFGPYNIKKMREEGELQHNVEGMLPTADFANFDEFLDANPAVLRSLLSSLNEKTMVKGRQILNLPLHLAYCATNIEPYVFLRKNPQAWAVFDRISFLDRIDYLENTEDIAEMVKRFQYKTSNIPKGNIDLSVINSICDFIIFPPTLIQDQLIIMKYAEAVVEYRKKRKETMQEIEKNSKENNQSIFDTDYQGILFQEISDRRICWASQMMEVTAILDGRIKVMPEDMINCHFMLGTSKIEEKIWIEICKQKIQEIDEMRKNELSELQIQQIENLRGQFEDIRDNGHDLDTRVNGVSTLKTQLLVIKPENTEVAKLFESLISEVDKYIKEISDEVLQNKGLKDKKN